MDLNIAGAVYKYFVPTALQPMGIKEPTPITVCVLKYDGAEHRRWPARLAQREGALVVLDAAFEFDVQHHLLGDIQRGTRTIEYYWLDRWYNVFRFLND